jgi:hypothetical protein
MIYLGLGVLGYGPYLQSLQVQNAFKRLDGTRKVFIGGAQHEAF